MKYSTHLFLIFAVFAVGCTPKKDKYEAFAIDLCACFRPMVDIQKDITDLIERGNQDSLLIIIDKVQKIDEDGQACVAALEKKYVVIQGEEEEIKAVKALRRVCPDIAAMMEEVEIIDP